jgi:thymidylate synthase (FAD)
MANVVLLTWTYDPEKIIALSAKTCYSPGFPSDMWYQDLNEGEFISKLKNMGHMTPFEHASFTFSLEGVSRVLLAQLTRHRIASFSVQSQRYVKYESSMDNYVVPDIPNELKEDFLDSCDVIYALYNEYVNCLMQDWGYSEKEAIENARYLLPGAMKTNLTVTMNARELMHFFELRCCNRAQKEIRDLAWKMLSLLQLKFPQIFEDCGPTCLTSKCKEGKMACGKPYKKEI